MDARVDQLQRACAADPRVIGLGGGLPSPTLFPRAALAASASRVLRCEGERALQYTWPEGRESLREWIAARLVRRGLNVHAREIVITNGAQEALSIAASLLLDAGEPVGVDPQSYPGALDVFRARGARFVHHGAPARCAYVMPAISNPEGRVATDSVRREWLAWASRQGAYLLEDDAYADLSFDGATRPSLAAHARDRVFHIGTLSKTLCPGLRIGWLIAPPLHHDEVMERKRVRDLQGNSLAQALVDDFLSRDGFDVRLTRARRFYARRAEALMNAMRRHLPEATFSVPSGGFALWVTLPERGDDMELLSLAVREGVCFDPGSMFRTQFDADAPIAFRLCFSLAPVKDFDRGVARLARAFRAWRQRQAPAARAG